MLSKLQCTLGNATRHHVACQIRPQTRTRPLSNTSIRTYNMYMHISINITAAHIRWRGSSYASKHLNGPSAVVKRGPDLAKELHRQNYDSPYAQRYRQAVSKFLTTRRDVHLHPAHTGVSTQVAAQTIHSLWRLCIRSPRASSPLWPAAAPGTSERAPAGCTWS